MSSLKQIVIISKERILQGLPDGSFRGDECYYLSDDYAAYLKIRQRFVGELNIHLLGRKFHEVIDEISKKFLSFSHRINRQNQSYAFWGTHLASRSSGTIPLLKYLVYFYCVRKILEHTESTRIVFISDSLALAKLIQKEAGKRGIDCRLHLKFLENIKPLWNQFRLVAKVLYSLFFMTSLWSYSRLLTNKRIAEVGFEGRKKYVFRSWITTGSLDTKGNYRDRNFGVLPDHLVQQGNDVWILPLYFNLDRNIFAQMQLMSRSRYQFLFPEQYLSLWDILKTLRDGVQSLFLDLEGCKFEGDDVGSLIREMHWSVSLQPLLLSFNSIKYLMKKMAKRKIGIDHFLYPIENNPPEKPFILGVRRYYPQSRITGFQHTVWFKEQLGVFLLPEELNYHPLPDQVICSGKRYPDILKETGFPASIVVPGPNLRYTAVNQNLKMNQPEETSLVRKILIILNYETNHNLELLEKTSTALRQLDKIKIYVKAHPTTDVKRMDDFLKDINFPAYEWAAGTVQDWVVQVHAVIMTGGSVSNLETMATGVPLIRVSLENNFDFDCLWDEYPFAPFTSSAAEIYNYLEKALQMNSEKRKELAEFGKSIIKYYFEPVTADNLKVFS